MKHLRTFNESEGDKMKEGCFEKIGFDFLKYEKRTKSFNCEKHGSVVADYYFDAKTGTEIAFECPLCEKEREETEKKDIEERLKRKREEYYKSLNIEPEFWYKTLDDYKPITEKQHEYLDAVKQLIAERRGKIITLGGNGTGKTMLGAIAVKEMCGGIFTMHELARDLRDCMKSGMSEKQAEEYFINLPLLVIDEIGRTKGSEYELNELSFILDKRHTRNLPVIILSNAHFARDCPQKQKGCEKCFERYFDNDLLSRFRQNAKFIVFEQDAPDKRDPRNKKLFE